MTITSIPTTMPGLIPGMLADSSLQKDCRASHSNDTNPIPPGYGVVMDSSNTSADAADGVKLPTGQSNVFKGIAIFGQSYRPYSEIDFTTGGYLPGITFDVLVHGACTVVVGAAVVPTDHVHLQVVADTGYPAGVFRKDADTGKTLDLSGFCVWRKGGDAVNPPVLEVNGAAAHAAVAD